MTTWGVSLGKTMSSQLFSLLAAKRHLPGHKKYIEGFDGEHILFVWDEDEERMEDCNFFFCYTQEKFDESNFQ